MQKNIVTTLPLLAMATLLGCQSLATPSQAGTGDRQQVNQVTWQKSGSASTINQSNAGLANNQSRLVFIRTPDQGNKETSTNLGIDNRFQVSLQGNHYSEVVTCSGRREISAQITGNQSNDLSLQPQAFNLDPKQTYYFQVIPSTTQASRLRPLNQQQAMALLANSQKQTHQISRVVADCPDNTPTARAVPLPVVSVSTPPTLVQQRVEPRPRPARVEEVSIEKPINVEVLFDFDSANIQPHYYPRLEQVAQYMRQNKDVQATLEGHTDSQGATQYNMQLSERRANAVKDMLINKYGIEATRLKTVGYGESRPITTNTNSQGRQQNRRVVAIVIR